MRFLWPNLPFLSRFSQLSGSLFFFLQNSSNTEDLNVVSVIAQRLNQRCFSTALYAKSRNNGCSLLSRYIFISHGFAFRILGIERVCFGSSEHV